MTDFKVGDRIKIINHTSTWNEFTGKIKKLHPKYSEDFLVSIEQKFHKRSGKPLEYKEYENDTNELVRDYWFNKYHLMLIDHGCDNDECQKCYKEKIEFHE